MTNTEKLSMIKTLMWLDDAEDERISVYLSAAEREILAWRYSYASNVPESVPSEYEMTQIHAVIAGYSISGAENQKKHTENGVAREFVYEDMISYIHSHVVPIVKVI